MGGKFCPIFPMIGKIFRRFSNDWKKFSEGVAGTTKGHTTPSSHARGVRRGAELHRRVAHRVSIHARAGRATGRARMRRSRSCFNSRTRGACDVRGFFEVDSAGVSIHARAGRATYHPGAGERFADVSIHARAGRATAEKARELRIRERIADRGRLTSTRALSEKWAVLLSKSEDFPRTFQGWNGSLGFAEGMTGRDTA